MKQSEKIAQLLEKGAGSHVQTFGHNDIENSSVSAFMAGKGKVIAAAVLATTIAFAGSTDAHADGNFITNNSNLLSGLARAAVGFVDDRDIRQGARVVERGFGDYQRDVREQERELERQQREVERQQREIQRQQREEMRAMERELREIEREQEASNRYGPR